MSWDEVMRINSDFLKEPLNFNNYINDISMFGQYSYVLDPENSKLWRELLCRSLTMFGHAAIHETVYNRLTDEDVDHMIRHNGRLGQSFNSFYGIRGFVSGGIDTILGSLTDAAYGKLEGKLQSGLYRYISEKTSGDTAGEWLGTVFGIDALKAKTTIESIVSDATLWTGTIMLNESLRRVICLSETTVNWFATNASEHYVDFINEVCTNTVATTKLFESLILVDGLTTFMNTETAVTSMASNRESMEAVIYMTETFAAVVNSEVAMTAVAASDVALNVIIDGIVSVTNSENALVAIKEALPTIEEQLPNIPDSESDIEKVVACKNNIAEVILALQETTTKADILVANIAALIGSPIAMSAIVHNDSARLAIEGSDVACEAMNSLLDLMSDVEINNSMYATNPVILYDGMCWISSVTIVYELSVDFTLQTVISGDITIPANKKGTTVINKFAERMSVYRNNGWYNNNYQLANVTYAKLH